MVCAYLEKLKQEYLEEKSNIDKAIVNLQKELEANIDLIKRLEESSDGSYEAFSPRDFQSKSKVKLKALEEKKTDMIQKIEEAEIKQIDLEQKIEELKDVMEAASLEAVKIKEIKQKNEKANSGKGISKLTILEIQENERQRISRELHDSTVQNLTGMVHKTELCSKLMEMDPIRCKLELSMMSRTLRDIINDTRQMIYNLRPMSFDDIGLDITIERAIDKIKTDKGCNIVFTVEGNSYSIHPVVGITLLRIIQEACNNAIKYADANIISVKMIYEQDEVIIIISDDGKGFDLEGLDTSSRSDNSGFGLSMMKERVYLLSGEIDISSEINVGTKIQVKVPIYSKEEK